MKRKLLSLAAITMSVSAFAGGFKIGLQGQKQIGMASCGTGLALDASSIYFNAGALAFTPNQITIGGTGLMPRTQYKDDATQVVTNAIAKTYSPFAAYASYGVNKKLVVGLGVYTPFGSGVAYPTGWTGRYALTEIALQTIFIKPTVSVKLNDNLSLGAGLAYSTGSVNLEKDIPLQGQAFTVPGHLQLNGKANGAGFDAGIYYTKDQFSIGASYRNKLNMNVKNGAANFTNMPISVKDSFPSGNFTSTLALPGEFSIGIGYKATPKLLIAADFNYTLWSSYDTLSFDFEKNTSNLSDVNEARLYSNAFAFRAGAQYAYSNKLNLRAGLFSDLTPISNGFVGPELPDANKLGATIGATYLVGRNLSIDASVLYENVEKRTQTNIATNMTGTFASKAIATGIGISYRFNNPKPKTN